MLGAAGRMGSAIIRVLDGASDVKLAAAVDHASSPKLGADAGALAGVAPNGVTVTGELPAAGVAGVWIDFSSPAATAANAAAAARAHAALVVGTTGVGDAGRQALSEAARTIPVVFAPNTSVGVKVLLKLVAEVERLFGP